MCLASQEDEHMELVKKRAEREEKKEKEQNMRRSASVYGDSRYVTTVNAL